MRLKKNSPPSSAPSGLHWNPSSPLNPYHQGPRLACITWGLDDSDSGLTPSSQPSVP